MKTILVTGANGQLGQCLKSLQNNFPNLFFLFKTSSELDLTSPKDINAFFSTTTINYCINCAAYTAVDLAEKETEKATLVNVKGVENLSKTCLKYDTTLIHISTDFVFDGNSSTPYKEKDITNPLSVYGLTKRNGENIIKETLEKYFIIRTSWLYSSFGSNFVKTMLKLSSSNNEINVVNDQIGSPTNALDLSNFLIHIISQNSNDFGIFHFSNTNQCSWYEFALEIFKLKSIPIIVNPISSLEFKTLALRPKFSVLCLNKTNKTFKFNNLTWKESLKNHLKGNKH